MSFVKRTAKGSARFVAIGLLLTLVSVFTVASTRNNSFDWLGFAGVSGEFKPEFTDLMSQNSKTFSNQSQLSNNFVAIPQDTKTVCDSGTPDFATVALAVADANAAVPAGGRTYLVCAGLVETAPAGGYAITATGASVANPVVFMKDGVGANPTITAPTPQTSGSLNDAIFKIIGADYITIDGFTMLENASNTTTTAGTNNMTEWGVALLYASTTNGAQNITLLNNTITLNRTYQNTFGIYSNSTHSATAVTSSITATTTAGGNSGLKIYGNTISNVNMGIVVVGPTAAADANTGVDIGGVGGSQSNSITNFGTTGTFSGYANVSGTVNGILVRNSIGFNVSFNTITSSVGGTTAGTLNGIQIPAASNAPTVTFTNTINNNNISLQSALITGSIVGITSPSGSASATSIQNINNNNFNTFGHTVAGASGTITFITNASTHFSSSINNNTFTNLSVNTTGSVTFISNSINVPAGGTQTINANSIVTAFNKTGAGGTVTGITTGGSSTTVTENWNNNIFSNITVTGATAITIINNTDGGTVNHNIIGNTISNITGGTSAIVGINSSFGGGNGGNGNLVSGNTISNINSAGAISGINIGSSGTTSTVASNTINTLSSTGASLVVGITTAAPTSATISKNKVYDLSNNNASGTVNGIAVTGGTLHTVSNNLVGDLRTTAANAANPLIGLNISGGTTVNAHYNTIYLNGASTGALFGSSALSASTTPALTLRNNIFANISSVAGAGLAVAYRRSSTTLSTYQSASNNNDFFAPTIYTDGTNTDTTIGAYKTRVSSRDSASFAENPPFLSTIGSNANFLHINTVTPTQLESGGLAVSGITDDFDGDTRNVATPDIGADEFTGVGLDLAPPAISYTTLGNTAGTSNRTLTATIGDVTAVDMGANLPRIYFKKSTDASYVSTQCSLISGTAQNGTYDCLINYSLVGGGSVTSGEIVQYFVAAQDTLGNFGTNPVGGTGSVNSVTFGGTPNSYNIIPSISGNKTVGAGGDYATLTAAVAALNSGEVTAPVTLTLTDASYTTPAETFPLTINANNGSSATNTVTIKPAVGISPSISGSTISCIINFNGADYMTIDGSNAVGGTTRDLTITNTNTGTASAVVCLTSLGVNAGATNDTVKNSNLVGSTVTATNGTLFGVISGSSTISTASAGADNDNNTIQNNNITKTQIGIYSGGASSANKNLGTVISQNAMNSASPNNLTNGGILVNFDDGVKVSQNDISIFRHDGTTGQIGTAYGIALGVVPSNTVTAFTGSDVVNAEVRRNRINGVTQLNSTGYSGFGIVVNSVTSGTSLVANNMISGIRTASTASDFSAGIVAGGGTGSTTQVYFNSVAMTGTRGAATFPSYGLAINSGNPIIDIKNNIFENIQTSSGSAKMYAIGTGSTTFTNMTSSYNDLYVVGANAFVGQTGGLGITGTDRLDLAAWNTTTGQDAAPNSKSVNPMFVSDTTDLHLMLTSTLESQGTPIGAITVDFDGDVRPATPDIGADEITPPTPGTIQFSSGTYAVGEGGGTVTLTVTRTGGSSGAVTANYALSNGTATGGASCGSGVDYINTGGSVMFADGDAGDKTFTVSVCDDALFEGSETFDSTLSIGSGMATLGTPNPATVTITDNDTQPTLQFSSSTYMVGEGGGTATITVTRTGAADNVVSVDYATNNGTATGGASCSAGVDYISASGNLNFAAGDLSKTFMIAICDDALAETSETVNLALSTPTGGAVIGTQGTAVLTINDNDMADYSVTTTGNAIVVTDNKDNGDLVTVSEPASGQINFASAGRTFQIDGGTIISGNSGNLSLAGVTIITFNGQGGNDNVNIGAFASALPSLTVNGGTGDDNINFNGSINFASNANLDVDLQNDDAAPGNDNVFVNPSTVLALSGTGTATIKVSQSVIVSNASQISVVNGNLTVEANQQATPTAGNFRGVSLLGGTLTTSGSGNILVKGKGGSGAFSGLRGVFSTSGAITSTSGAVGAGTITIVGTGGAGIGTNRGVEIFNTTNAVTSIRGDISITGQGGAGTTTNNVGVIITGPAGIRSFGAAKITINGTGGTGTSIATGVRLLNFGTEVTSAGGDISIIGNGGISATGSGNHGATVGFGAIISATNGAKITFNGTAGGGTFGSAGVIISLPDQTVTTAFSQIISDSGDISITGDGGTGSGAGGGGNIGVNLNSGGIVAATGAANVTINGTGGSCPDPTANDCYGVDFESSNTAGTAVTSVNGNINVIGTSVAATGLRQNGIRFEDSSGSFPFTMTTGSGSLTLNATGGNSDPTSTALIFADDTTMTLGGATNTFIADTMEIGTSQVTINAGANALSLRQKTNTRDIDLGGSDTATVLGLTDTELDVIVAGTLNIGDANTGNINITSNISRSASTGINLVSGASIDANSGSVDSGGGNVNSDPASFMFAGNSGVDFTTGAASTFKIASGRTLRLTIGGTTADTTYQQLNVAGQVDITGVNLLLSAASTPSGGETYTIVNNDGTDAITGTFVGLGEGATIPNFLGSGLPATISYVGGSGNDCVITVGSAPTLQFSAATVSIGEGGGMATLTVTRTGATNPVSVQYATTGGTATSGASCTTGVDFVAASGTLNFGLGDTSKTFDVTICDDSLFESNENFTASLSNASGGAVIGMPSTEAVTITENDTAPTFQFSSATYSTTESLDGLGGTGILIAVTRTGATENAVSVNYATSNGTATGGANCTAGVDYRSTSGTLSFGSGVTSLQFFVETCQDFVFEGDETVNLALSSPTAPAVLGTPNTAVLTIVENDPQPSVQFSASSYIEDESQNAGLTITRTGDTSGTTTVNFATSNGTATGGAACTAGVDYITTSGTVTFNPGNTSQVVSVQLCSDIIAESMETVNLTLSSPSSPAILGTPNLAILNINDTATQYLNNTPIAITNGTVSSASAINITGGPTQVGSLKVTLYDVNHNFSDDLDVLLVGPQGQKFILMGDAGGSNGLSSSATITFDDQAGQILPDNGVIATGKYEPTNWETPVTSFGAPAPMGPYSEPGNTVGGMVTLNSVFAGTNSNGTWNLYIRDDAGAFVPAGTGAVSGGWGLQILAPTAANAEISGRVMTANGQGIRNATVMVSGGNLTEPIYVQTTGFGNYRFDSLPVGASYVITVISRRYTFANPSRVINLTDNATEENFVAELQ